MKRRHSAADKVADAVAWAKQQATDMTRPPMERRAARLAAEAMADVQRRLEHERDRELWKKRRQRAQQPLPFMVHRQGDDDEAVPAELPGTAGLVGELLAAGTMRDIFDRNEGQRGPELQEASAVAGELPVPGTDPIFRLAGA